MADIERVFVFCLPGGRGGGRMAAKGWMVVAYEFGGQLANGTGRVEVEREDVSGWSRSGRRGGWGADGLGGERGLVVNPDGHTTSMPERCGGGVRWGLDGDGRGNEWKAFPVVGFWIAGGKGGMIVFPCSLLGMHAMSVFIIQTETKSSGKLPPFVAHTAGMTGPMPYAPKVSTRLLHSATLNPPCYIRQKMSCHELR